MEVLELVNKYEVFKELDQKINILPIIISPCVTLNNLFFDFIFMMLMKIAGDSYIWLCVTYCDLRMSLNQLS